MSTDRAELGSKLEWLYQNTTSIDYADVLAVYDSGYADGLGGLRELEKDEIPNGAIIRMIDTYRVEADKDGNGRYAQLDIPTRYVLVSEPPPTQEQAMLEAIKEGLQGFSPDVADNLARAVAASLKEAGW